MSMNIRRTCQHCGGTGIPLRYGSSGTCTACDGTGKTEIGFSADLEDKLNDIENKIDDVINKCNDILEALQP